MTGGTVHGLMCEIMDRELIDSAHIESVARFLRSGGVLDG